MTISRADIDGLVSKLTAHAGDIPSMIRDDERKRGFAIVLPGEVEWLPWRDWHPDTVVSIRGLIVVRLVLLYAKAPGRGALRRTLDGLWRARLRPEVIDPTDRLAAFLARHGYAEATRGSTFEDREHVWGWHG